MGIEHARIIAYDRGDYTFLTEKLAESAAEVWSFTPIMGRQPKYKEDQIGSGFDGVEKIDDFEAYVDKADLIFFPGEFDGELCDKLRKQGHRTFGSGLNAELEINRIAFLEALEKVGLKVIKTYLAEGLDEAYEYLKDKTDKWLKFNYCRADLETFHYQNMKTFKGWIDHYKVSLGVKAAAEMDILIQDSFPSIVESGTDRYVIGNKMSLKGTFGYEDKDKSYIYKVTDKFPEILDEVDQKIATQFKDYFGAYSSEDRINKNGDRRFTDLTARFGLPPSEGICEIYKKFGQDVLDVANGVMPKMEEKAPYGSIILLSSDWNTDQEICVDYPKEFKDNVKLSHSYKFKGDHFCLPNENDGYFGAVVTYGNSVKEVAEQANEIAEQVICLQKKYDPIDLKSMEETIKNGEKFGIIF